MVLPPNEISKHSSDPSLVAEQSGFSTSLVSLAIAIVLGLLVRGALAPEKIKLKINEGIQRVGGGIQVSFDQAYVSLSRGGWPDLAVVITNAHIESNKKCWLSPDAEINELRFPISIVDALLGKSFVHKVEVDRVVLLLRTELVSGCDEGRLPAATQAETTGAVTENSMVGRGVKAMTAAGVRPDIKSLTINRLKVNYLPIPFTSFEFLDVDVDVDSLEPRVFQISTALDLGGETLSGDYSSHAKIEVDYDQNHTPQLQLQVRGSWREGRYEIVAQHTASSAELALTGELMHLPFSQVFPLLRKYKLMTSDLNGKQTWLSTKFAAHGKVTSYQQIPLTLKDFKIEGDLGEISLPQAEISSLAPLKFEPLKFNLRALDLEQFLIFFNRPHPNQAFGKLGVFDGTATLNENRSLEITGVQKGLELIFSNKGNREYQQIQGFDAKLKFADELWVGEVGAIKFQDGEVDGKVSFNADRDWRELKVRVDLERFSLSPKVQTLMTQGGEAKDLQFKAEAHLSKGELKGLSGLLAGEKINFEGVHLARPKFKFANRGDEFQVDFSGSETVVSNVRVFDPIWSRINAETSNLEETIKFKKVSAKFKTKGLQDFSWSGVELLGDQVSLVSQGGWDFANNLYGQVQVREKGKLKKWNISGNRDQPNFTKD